MMDEKEAKKLALRLRLQQLKDCMAKIPPEVVNGGIERAKGFKAWAAKATKAAARHGNPTIEQLDTLLGEYRALQSPNWLPPSKL